MDRDNKYYNLIESLVKKHKKFPGYEAILEDIIDDVYAHSEVIINSVDNESVVQSYLEKVISTSIIIVPKKLHYNTRTTHRVITKTPIVNNPINETVSPKEETPVIESQVETIEKEPELDNDIKTFTDNIVAEKANPKLVDQMINTMNSDLVDTNSNKLEEKEISDNEPQMISSSEDVDIDIPEVVEEAELTDNTQLNDSGSFDVGLNEDNDAQLLLNEDVEEVVDSPEIEMFEEQDSISFVDSSEPSLEEEIIEEPQIIENEPVALSLDDNLEDDDGVNTVVQEEELSAVSEPESVDEVISEEEVLSEDGLGSENIDINDEETISLDVVNDEEETELISDISEESEPSDDMIELNIVDDSSDMGLAEAADDEDIDSVSLIQEDNIAPAELDEDALSIGENIGSDLINEEDNSLEETIDFNQEDSLEISEDLPELGSDVDLMDETISIDSDNLESFDNVADEDISIQPSLTIEDDIELQDNSQDEADVLALPDEQDVSLDIRLESNKTDIVHKSSDYSVFEYNPDEVHSFVDVKQITENLLRLNSEKPNAQVLKIFDLRYKQNYTLEQIASELNVTKDDVITILNDIVELV